MNFDLISILALSAAVIFGGGVVLLVWRFRELYVSRARRERYRQMVVLARKRNELSLSEARLKQEAVHLAKEEELRRRDAAAEASRAESTRLAEAAAAQATRLAEAAATHAAEARRLEEEARARKTDAENECARFRELALRAAVLSPAEARKTAIEEVRRECAAELARLRQETLLPGEEEIRAEARRLLLATMQRIAPEVVQEASAAIVPIPGEETKGRLIGREGRNIKSFEQATGTSLLIDETPNSVLVSSFDPVRREIARLALESLIRDGRIHPGTIEEFVEKARGRVISSACEYGSAAINALGLHAPFPTVVETLGRLHFRLSLNQDTLAHSIEVARLSGLIAAELGVDPVPAKRAGLFHDIGKAMEAEVQGDSHATSGARLLKRCDEDPRVVNAVAAHHGEVEADSLYAPILVLADRISATRPGARASSLDGYVERMKNLETIARDFPGVVEAYALYAGREIRVIVSAGRLTPDESRETARKIRLRVEDELQYPGTIRIVVIHEQRFHEEAR